MAVAALAAASPGLEAAAAARQRVPHPLGPAPPQQRQFAAPVRWGIADQRAAVFGNPLLPALEQRAGVSAARLVIRWDVLHHPAALRATDAWVAGARARGLEIDLTPGAPEDGMSPPSLRRYRQEIRRLMARYPDVRAWGAFNEPDLEDLSPTTAARYWVIADREARRAGRGAVVLAGEFALANPHELRRGGFVAGYAAELHRLGLRPRVWSFHAYSDVFNRDALITGDFLRFLGPAWGSPEIWLTEQGVLLRDHVAFLSGRPRAQAASARTLVDLPNLSPRIRRAYFYQLQSDPSGAWDSALADAHDVPRPAYCVAVRLPVQLCKGDTGAASLSR